jgi:hypothetical protein
LLSDEGLQPLVYGMFPALKADFPLARKSQRDGPGLRLYETFIPS